jgi:hypothetical protein
MAWYWWMLIAGVVAFSYANMRVDMRKFRGHDWTHHKFRGYFDIFNKWRTGR